MLTRIPKIKICGVTIPADLDFILTSGADTIGINLVPTSKRYVVLDHALELNRKAKALGLQTVAVLMNPSAEFLSRVNCSTDWDFIQLHGSESPELLAGCPSICVIKAISWTGRPEEAALVRLWDEWGRGPFAAVQPMSGERPPQRLSCFLVDAFSPTEGGGTGRSADWGLLNPRPAALRDWPVILAGGLHPDNVRNAVIATACDGVDVASGVEIVPGRKSAELVSQFATEAFAGFNESAVKPLQ